MVGREWTPAEHVDGGARSQRCDRATREPADRSGNRRIRWSHLETGRQRPARFTEPMPSRATRTEIRIQEYGEGPAAPVSADALRNRRHPSKTRTVRCKVTEGAAKTTELHRRFPRNPSPIQKMSLAPGPSTTADSIASRATCRQQLSGSRHRRSDA